MTLLEISHDYETSAALLSKRLKELRQMMKTETDPEKLWHIRRRIVALTPLLTEMNELADLTAHYLQGMSLPAIARMRGVNKTSVYRIFYRAEKKMRKFLMY